MSQEKRAVFSAMRFQVESAECVEGASKLRQKRSTINFSAPPNDIVLLP
jgi:hypothetical protein